MSLQVKTVLSLGTEDSVPGSPLGQQNKQLSNQGFWVALFLTGKECENIQTNILEEKQIAGEIIPFLKESLTTIRKIPVPVIFVDFGFTLLDSALWIWNLFPYC